MKIRPVILCGGAGTRLWPNQKKHQAKQFIDFGGWTLLDQTLQRIRKPIFDNPIISTNFKYLKKIKVHLKKNKFKKYKIILEPSKKNTGPAILIAALADLEKHKFEQPLLFLSADHSMEKENIFYKAIRNNKKNLTDKNIFIFGIKPTSPSSQYGYFLTKKVKNNINKVTKFIEKPNLIRAKKVIKNKGYWNSGMFLLNTASLIYNFMKYNPKIYWSCVKTLSSLSNTKYKNNICYLDKKLFDKVPAKSFDYAILEKAKKVNAIKLSIPWSDLGSWKEISKLFYKSKKKYYNKSNVFYRPWGKYINLYSGKGFLVKELVINPKSSISLQKHHHRSEHWTITSGIAKITINKKKFYKNVNETAFIPKGAIHRIENHFSKPVKIMEIQTGSILRETDIVRYKDIYGRASS